PTPTRAVRRRRARGERPLGEGCSLARGSSTGENPSIPGTATPLPCQIAGPPREDREGNGQAHRPRGGRGGRARSGGVRVRGGVNLNGCREKEGRSGTSIWQVAQIPDHRYCPSTCPCCGGLAFSVICPAQRSLLALALLARMSGRRRLGRGQDTAP